MTPWLVLQTARHAPRRLVLAALGVAFPVAMLAATLLFVDLAVNTMTGVALQPVQLEQRALATSLDIDAGKLTRDLANIPAVSHVDRFAAADVVVRVPGVTDGASARLFAVDPSYFRNHPWVKVADGSFGQGALLDQSLRGYSKAFGGAREITVEIPGGGGATPLRLPASGTVDLRQSLATWFAIPAGEVQGDIALVPRAIVIPYDTFQQALLPAFRAKLGPTTPVLNPGLTDLPPISIEAHIAIDHAAYPSDPSRAATWSASLRHVIERTVEPGSVVVSDHAAEPLLEASADATNAKILFLLLGIPGALVAAALGLAAQSALAEAQRREDALLRLRGATEPQLARIASAHAAAACVAGSVVGLIAAIGAVAAVEGRSPTQIVSATNPLGAVLAAVAVGAGATALRVVLLVRASRRGHLVSARRLLERGWRPLWLRAGLDFVAIGLGIAILAANIGFGGLQPTPVAAAQRATLSLSFYVLLAPIALWIGIALLAVRIALASSRRARHGRTLPSWRRASLRWLGRRPARTGVAFALGVLAVAFGTQVLGFVETYQTAKRADANAAFGSDIRLTPGDPLAKLPSVGPGVSAVTPIREVPVRVGSDRKTLLALDPATYAKATTAAPWMVSGSGLDALRRDPTGVIVSQELADDLGVGSGDSLPITLLPDDKDRSQNVTLHVVGVYRSFPPSNPFAELVGSVAGVPAHLVTPPDFYLARDAAGRPPDAVAAELRTRPGVAGKVVVTTRAEQAALGPRSLTALNLAGLSRIEAIGAALIAAVGIAVLGAFLVIERRREFATLEAVGADRRQIRTGPALEGLAAVIGSVIVGVPLGLLLGVLDVRVLGLFFTLPPPLLTVPAWQLAALVALVAATSAIALAGALRQIGSIDTPTLLREP